MDIPMKIVYVKRDRIQGRLGDSPDDVSVQMIGERNMVPVGGPVKKPAYNVGQLVSFPDNSPVKLHDREIKRLQAKITIPSDFPDELLNVPIMMLISARVRPDIVGCQPEHLQLYVTD